MGSRNSVLTCEEIDEVINLYRNGMSTPKLAKKFGVHSNAIRGLLDRRGIKFRSASESKRKYSINETFFDIIDSEEKAYVLGLFYSDGSNNIKRNKAYISLAETDVDILEKIKMLISPDKPLLYSVRPENNPKHQNRYMFYIDNKHISIRLSELGCVTNKTHILEFPEWIGDDLCKHFIRGYFDGDGHIGIYKNKLKCSIVSTESFCLSIIKLLEKMEIDNKLYCRFPNRDTPTRDLHINKKEHIIKFLKWLYDDAKIYMNRKYNKYLEAKEIYERGKKA